MLPAFLLQEPGQSKLYQLHDPVVIAAVRKQDLLPEGIHVADDPPPEETSDKRRDIFRGTNILRKYIAGLHHFYDLFIACIRHYEHLCFSGVEIDAVGLYFELFSAVRTGREIQILVQQLLFQPVVSRNLYHGIHCVIKFSAAEGADDRKAHTFRYSTFFRHEFHLALSLNAGPRPGPAFLSFLFSLITVPRPGENCTVPVRKIPFR